MYCRLFVFQIVSVYRETNQTWWKNRKTDQTVGWPLDRNVFFSGSNLMQYFDNYCDFPSLPDRTVPYYWSAANKLNKVAKIEMLGQFTFDLLPSTQSIATTWLQSSFYPLPLLPHERRWIKEARLLCRRLSKQEMWLSCVHCGIIRSREKQVIHLKRNVMSDKKNSDEEKFEVPG